MALTAFGTAVLLQLNHGSTLAASAFGGLNRLGMKAITGCAIQPVHLEMLKRRLYDAWQSYPTCAEGQFCSDRAKKV